MKSVSQKAVSSIALIVSVPKKKMAIFNAFGGSEMEEEEEYDGEEITEPDRRYAELIDTLHAAHMDNARLRYFARGSVRISVCEA